MGNNKIYPQMTQINADRFFAVKDQKLHFGVEYSGKFTMGSNIICANLRHLRINHLR